MFDLSGQLTAAKDLSQKARERALKIFSHDAHHPLVLFFKRPDTRLRLLKIAHAAEAAELVIAAFRCPLPTFHLHSWPLTKGQAC